MGSAAKPAVDVKALEAELNVHIYSDLTRVQDGEFYVYLFDPTIVVSKRRLGQKAEERLEAVFGPRVKPIGGMDNIVLVTEYERNGDSNIHTSDGENATLGQLADLADASIFDKEPLVIETGVFTVVNWDGRPKYKGGRAYLNDYSYTAFIAPVGGEVKFDTDALIKTYTDNN